ncbi:unnamed protein product [Amoebophrya sp. A120]|nr:unnamed protein product [Amoebophrya sp. A120]|eukprot:GSA120T00013991001.1
MSFSSTGASVQVVRVEKLAPAAQAGSSTTTSIQKPQPHNMTIFQVKVNIVRKQDEAAQLQQGNLHDDDEHKASNEIKNSILLLAKEYPMCSKEWFAKIAAHIFSTPDVVAPSAEGPTAISAAPQQEIKSVTVTIEEELWERVYDDVHEQFHHHVWRLRSPEKKWCVCDIQDCTNVARKQSLKGGVRNLTLLKTGEMGLGLGGAAGAQVLATSIDAEWLFREEGSTAAQTIDYDTFNQKFIKTLVTEFAGHPEQGVFVSSLQKTFSDMAEAVITRFGASTSTEIMMNSTTSASPLPLNCIQKVKLSTHPEQQYTITPAFSALADQDFTNEEADTEQFANVFTAVKSGSTHGRTIEVELEAGATTLKSPGGSTTGSRPASSRLEKQIGHLPSPVKPDAKPKLQAEISASARATATPAAPAASNADKTIVEEEISDLVAAGATDTPKGPQPPPAAGAAALIEQPPPAKKPDPLPLNPAAQKVRNKLKVLKIQQGGTGIMYSDNKEDVKQIAAIGNYTPSSSPTNQPKSANSIPASPAGSAPQLPLTLASATTSQGQQPCFFAKLGIVSRTTYIEKITPCYPKCPWLVEKSWPKYVKQVDFLSAMDFLLHLRFVMEQEPQETQLKLLRDYANFVEEELFQNPNQPMTNVSATDKQKFLVLNGKYANKFFFPFVLAISGFSMEKILEILGKRLENSFDQELHEGMRQVHRIAEIQIRKVVY